MAKENDAAKTRNNCSALKKIAALLKLTEFEIKKFIHLGLPKVGNNKFVPAECFRWYIDYLHYWKDGRTISKIAAMFGVTER